MSGLHIGPNYDSRGLRIGCGWYKLSDLTEPLVKNSCDGCFWKNCCPAPLSKVAKTENDLF